MVSHDTSEIYRLSDRILVLDQGKIIDDGLSKNNKKFSFNAELLEIIKDDGIYIAVISIAEQLVKMQVSEDEAGSLKVGEVVNISTKAFSPIIT